MSVVLFNHSGAMGDILYSLYFVHECIESMGRTPQEVIFNVPEDVMFTKTSGKK